MSLIHVHAPVSGRCLPLSGVPDPVFAAGLVGPGVAIEPTGDGRSTATAPIGGVIVKLHPHAFVVEAPDGAAVLVHLGIDTVQLAGSGFELLVSENATVAVGDPVVAWRPTEVEAEGFSRICPVVALDAQPAMLSDTAGSSDVAVGDPLFSWRIPDPTHAG